MNVLRYSVARTPRGFGSRHVLHVDLAVVLGRYVHALVAGGQTGAMLSC